MSQKYQRSWILHALQGKPCLCKIPWWLHEFGSGSTFMKWEESTMAAFPARAEIDNHKIYFMTEHTSDWVCYGMVQDILSQVH